MSEQTNEKGALVPRLRFPEFRDAGEWVQAPLGRLFSERQEAGQTNLPLLSLMDKKGIVPQEDSNRKNNSSADKSKYLRVVPGDIAYNTMRMWEGRSAYVGLEGLISPAYTVCVPVEGISSVFFSYYFKTASLIRQFRKYSQGLVKDTLNLKFEAFSRIDVPYPAETREQQKIADCLSSLDELIAAESQKLTTLKTHKKGLMQQLFPREGETVPRLRFSEFREGPAWGKEKLEKLITTVSPPSKLQSSNYGTQGKFPIIDQSQEFICGWTDDERAVITESLPLIIFGDHTCALKFVDKPFAQGADGIKILKVRPAISAEYLFHSLSHRPLAMEDYKRHFSMLKERAVVFPDIESGEQQKIADCLFSLDDLITAQTQKIDVLKTHKKGLMQQLFPVLDEVQP